MKTIKILAPYVVALFLLGIMALTNCFGMANNKVYKPCELGYTIDDSCKYLTAAPRLMRDDTND